MNQKNELLQAIGRLGINVPKGHETEGGECEDEAEGMEISEERIELSPSVSSEIPLVNPIYESARVVL